MNEANLPFLTASYDFRGPSNMTVVVIVLAIKSPNDMFSRLV